MLDNWIDGAGGAPLAVSDFNKDGLDDIVGVVESAFYTAVGKNGETMAAARCNWQNVGDTIPIWTAKMSSCVPLADGGNAFAFRYIESEKSRGALIASDGKLIRALESAYYTLGDFDGDGTLEMLFLDETKGARCEDAATDNIKWSMPVDALPGFESHGACADLDGDGRDEAILLKNQTLYCIKNDETNQKGNVAWTVQLPGKDAEGKKIQYGEPIIADVGGKGELSILVEGSDGWLYCLEP